MRHDYKEKINFTNNMINHQLHTIKHEMRRKIFLMSLIQSTQLVYNSILELQYLRQNQPIFSHNPIQKVLVGCSRKGQKEPSKTTPNYPPHEARSRQYHSHTSNVTKIPTNSLFPPKIVKYNPPHISHVCKSSCFSKSFDPHFQCFCKSTRLHFVFKNNNLIK